jgi:phosphoglucomutase
MSGTVSAKKPPSGLKVVTASGWFAVQLSGTDEDYKLYAESFRGSLISAHL